ncbi:phosphate ABC transporter substrate-binding protein PstS family protein [Virgibacillus sediminis]|uniref:Phosphate-binding protein n=1 Tax=Virgibacillus sediminis TaxID=202260 RepID=A0ABV7A8C3_9BACI
MKLKKYLLLVAAAVMAIVLAACGGSGDSTEDASAGESAAGANGEETSETEAEADLEGSVVIDGSGTVYPLMARLAEEYMINEQPQVSVEVSRAGTSAGFERFLQEDGTDFNNASRPIKDEELAKAEELGFEPMEMKLALDGLTIVINPENDWATELTEQQVKDIFTADGGVTTWSDINPDWPDKEIEKVGPNENHGTYEFFYENILEEQDLDPNANLQQEYSTLVNLVAEDKNAIGFFGYGYYDSNKDSVKAVSIDFGDGPVEPSLDTIAEDGPYANFTRPVFTYLNPDMAKEKAQVHDYALYVMESVNDFAGETGFAPLPEEEIQAQLEEIEALN